MPRTLTILGGGGWFPAHGRHTNCALLRQGNAAIMIDAGTGVGRLVERRELLDGVEQLDILLTHFHLDHIAGLAYLPAIGLCEHTTVWGPGALMYGTQTTTLLEEIASEPFHPVPLSAQDIQVRDLPAGEIELAGVRVTHRRQDRHSAPTVGYRFDDELTWVTDTGYDPETASFAAGCRLLAHEAWFTEGNPRNPEVHSSAAEAAQLAARGAVERLLLIHLPPFEQSLNDLLREAKAGISLALTADDGADFSELLA